MLSKTIFRARADRQSPSRFIYAMPLALRYALKSVRRKLVPARSFSHAEGLCVVCYHSISDPQKLAAYAKLAPAATAPFGARYLARGTAAAAFEAGLKERVVITEYPSLDKAKGAYDCAAYQEAMRAPPSRSATALRSASRAFVEGHDRGVVEASRSRRSPSEGRGQGFESLRARQVSRNSPKSLKE